MYLTYYACVLDPIHLYLRARAGTASALLIRACTLNYYYSIILFQEHLYYYFKM